MLARCFTVLAAFCVASTTAVVGVRCQVTWTTNPVNAPNALADYAMAYDAAHRRTVLFGGNGTNSGYVYDETWEWDGVRWQQRQVPGPVPAGRHCMSMVWDSARQRCVMFGGARSGYGSVDHGDTWEWNGTSWTLLATTGPTPRSLHSMAYDAARDRVVLFGGASWRYPQNDDTWEWDGQIWIRRAPVNRPPVRIRGVMVYDALRQRTVLHGGITPAGTGLTDTWEWDGTNWTLRSAVGPWVFGAGFFDPARGRVVIQGSTASTPPQMWEWDGTTWTSLHPALMPTPRFQHTAAYDVQRGRAVIYGGYPQNDITWEWDGTTWHRAVEGGGARSRHGAAYDSVRQRMVIAGGIGLDDTWEWDGERWWGPWSFPGGWVDGHAMAFDATRGSTVLFGGTAGNDTWSWDGATWQQRSTPVSPPARAGHAMVAEDARSRLLLFGGRAGSAMLSDSWAWDGASWSRLAPASSPPARTEHAMAYDHDRDRVVLFGGQDTSGQALGDTWEWDGRTWRAMAPANSPRPISEVAMAYDAFRRRTVLHTGPGETWEWDGADWTLRPPLQSPVWSSGSGYGPGVMVFDTRRSQVALFGGLNGLTVWYYGTTRPASFQPLEPACAGTAGPPRLTGEPGTGPWTGGPFTARVQSLPLGAPVGLAVGASSTTWGGLGLPLALPGTGSPGCFVLVSVEVFVPLANSGGVATWTLGVPANPALVGQSFYEQALVLDPRANAFGVTSSNGARAVIGAR